MISHDSDRTLPIARNGQSTARDWIDDDCARQHSI